MAFFRKWKTHYKHKKFTSDEALDGEDWGLETSAKGSSQANGKAKNKDSKESPKLSELKHELESGIEPDDEEANRPIFETYDIKYLGCTPIDAKPSEKSNGEAIKTVIANSKAGGRKNKSQKRVKMIVSNEGIEVLDYHTSDRLMAFSIYQISYCSVDAAHDHAFSFVGSEKDPLSDLDKMSCHVFLCPKRKVAHEITLTVALCFRDAYHQWHETVMQHTQLKSSNGGSSSGSSTDERSALKEKNAPNIFESRVEVHPLKSDNNNSSPLIDLASSDNEVRKFLQNTWVSFEEEMVGSASASATSSPSSSASSSGGFTGVRAY